MMNAQRMAATGNIEFIHGHKMVLLIAPHGFNGDRSRNLKADDENTGKLARAIAWKLGCSAIINEFYKKPHKDERTREEVADSDNDRINVNRYNQVEKYLKDEFLLPLMKETDNIVKEQGSALVVWIHGIDDANITNGVVDGNPDETHAVIGMGQGNPDDRPTAQRGTVNELMRLLTANGMKTGLAKEESSYCGWHENIMNQVFRKKNYPLTSVQSIQIELRKNGFRDTEAAIKKSVEILSTALSTLTQALEPIAREVDIDQIKVDTAEDRQYIFRESLDLDTEYQRIFDAKIDGLAQSIKNGVLINPLLLLQKADGTFKILCGYRRYLALKRLGEPKARAEIYPENSLTHEQCMELSLAENTERQDLNPIEIGKFLHTAREQLRATGKRGSYQELADRYGKTLGIGTSHTSTNQYLLLYEIWREGASKELVRDIFQEKVQFGLALSLANIKDTGDRNALYEKVVKPLSLTRPELEQVKTRLDRMSNDQFLKDKYGSDYGSILATDGLKAAIARASNATKKGREFINEMNRLIDDISARKEQGFSERSEALIQAVFERAVDLEEFSIVPSPRLEKPEVTIQFKLTKDGLEETIPLIKKFLEREQDIAEMIGYLGTTSEEIEELI